MTKKILVVDDSASIRQMVEFTLKSVGYITTTANDGQDALAKAKTSGYDLILTDLNMPKMDGLSMIKSLRTIPSYKTTPILLLTTESSDSMKQQGRAAGATGWLVKPFDPQKLVDTIKKVLPG